MGMERWCQSNDSLADGQPGPDSMAFGCGKPSGFQTAISAEGRAQSEVIRAI